MSVSKKQVVREFNDNFITLINNLAVMCPQSRVGKNIWIYRKVLKVLKYTNKIIDLFVQKALIYKSRIDNDDVDFLLNRSYDDEVNDHYKDYHKLSKRERKKLEDEKKDAVDIIYEVKEVWPTMNKKDQDLVVQFLKVLSSLAEEYFLIVHAQSQTQTQTTVFRSPPLS